MKLKFIGGVLDGHEMKKDYGELRQQGGRIQVAAGNPPIPVVYALVKIENGAAIMEPAA